ncbi:hypothetical protein [Chryseobacterium oryctis]|uniref:Uncharacterized protein n=1 Tax=Chryseobacterium oryctis TaxID=2952618 RepID=A0ABT3HJ09_9FLAO|nr:hypothetical protein [Chryseobacterium oryctis]MCW3159754.1 hypothetical protein [Chryseobacterium oryctis]
MLRKLPKADGCSVGKNNKECSLKDKKSCGDNHKNCKTKTSETTKEAKP